jgi:hypothetical protein
MGLDIDLATIPTQLVDNALYAAVKPVITAPW